MPEVNFERSVFIKHELARIAAGKPIEALDESRWVFVGRSFVGGVGWMDSGARMMPFFPWEMP